MQRCFGFGGGERKNTLWPAVCFLEEPKSQLWASDILYIPRISIPTPQMTSTFEGQPESTPKTMPFPIKTRVIWVLDIYIYLQFMYHDSDVVFICSLGTVESVLWR